MNKDFLGGTSMEMIIWHEAIWDKYQDEDKFIEVFAKVDAHETLHVECIKAMREQHERIVEMMLE
jgi:hypothetical protein